jgi:hypothetical protein
VATSIQFTDAIGAATLNNAKAVPGDRFSGWVTTTKPVGDSAPRLSDGAITMIKFRDDFGASFSLTQIPVATVGGVRLVDVAARLIAWLMAGGTCTVNTGDVSGSSYATCGLMPGTTPTLQLTDRINLEYSLNVSLINVAASPVAMVCHYAA